MGVGLTPAGEALQKGSGTGNLCSVQRPLRHTLISKHLRRNALGERAAVPLEFPGYAEPRVGGCTLLAPRRACIHSFRSLGLSLGAVAASSLGPPLHLPPPTLLDRVGRCASPYWGALSEWAHSEHRPGASAAESCELGPSRLSAPTPRVARKPVRVIVNCFCHFLKMHHPWSLLFHYKKSQRNHPAGSIRRGQPDSFLVLY